MLLFWDQVQKLGIRHKFSLNGIKNIQYLKNVEGTIDTNEGVIINEKIEKERQEKINLENEKQKQKELKINLKMFDKLMSKGIVNGNIPTIDYTSSDTISDIIQIYLHKKYKLSTCKF
mgnify:CR=1 FL=1